ncbi:CysB family HTH-type transcriptional regulator [Hydrogenophilus thiooxidans]|uniref:CysB family HTH-type transcriptional regulator n=1 Tax=Hydrogenophilus thiooxidans TaxID=2820326 RepID=UPI001C244507|nr:CysB family HTH-type transcriptional regulator [Hydrogenophilus thiooxidans]
MNLQQLRYVVEVIRHGMSVSDAAESMFTSQPGVSKQIRALEEELGVEIFVRHGKRLTGLTEPGKQVVALCERILRDVHSLYTVAEEFAKSDDGVLAIATTHTQARYVLPPVIDRFRRLYPKVRFSLHQGSPRYACEMVLAGDADLVIATEAISEYPELVELPCYQWTHSLVVPKDHPLATVEPLSLEAIAQYPLITYDGAFTGRDHINKAFLGRALKPTVALTAIDSDVIKTYVRLGLGVGIIAKMAFDPAVDSDLVQRDLGHLIESNVTRIGILRNAYLRGFVYAFIETLAPHLKRDVVARVVRGEGSLYEL